MTTEDVVRRRLAEIAVQIAELESQCWSPDLAKERAALLRECDALGWSWLQQLIEG
jgi:hypothetical protein